MEQQDDVINPFRRDLQWGIHTRSLARNSEFGRPITRIVSNPYQYSNYNPINKYDPNGTDPEDPNLIKEEFSATFSEPLYIGMSVEQFEQTSNQREKAHAEIDVALAREEEEESKAFTELVESNEKALNEAADVSFLDLLPTPEKFIDLFQFLSPTRIALDYAYWEANSRPDAGVEPAELPPGGTDWSSGGEGGLLADPAVRIAAATVADSILLGAVGGTGGAARSTSLLSRTKNFVATRAELFVVSREGVQLGARSVPLAAHVSNKTPLWTYSHGYNLGLNMGEAGQTLVLGKFPGNVRFVNSTAGTYTLDRPWGWTKMYNAGAVRGHLEAGGNIRFTSQDFTGTFGLEANQVLNNNLWSSF